MSYKLIDFTISSHILGIASPLASWGSSSFVYVHRHRFCSTHISMRDTNLSLQFSINDCMCLLGPRTSSLTPFVCLRLLAYIGDFVCNLSLPETGFAKAFSYTFQSLLVLIFYQIFSL